MPKRGVLAGSLFGEVSTKVSMFTIIDEGPRLREETLSAFEQSQGFELPGDYKQFLLKYNGGRPTPSDFQIIGFKNSDVGSVKTFLGLRRSPDTSNLDWYPREVPGILPLGVQPIATTSGPDLVVMSCNKKDYGQVYYWDSYNAPKRADWKDLYVLAGSLQEFLGNLFEDRSRYSSLEILIKSDDVSALERLINNGYDLNHLDECGRNALENAVILNRPKVIKFLHSKGGKLRTARTLAEQNAECFPEFQETLRLIKELEVK